MTLEYKWEWEYDPYKRWYIQIFAESIIPSVYINFLAFLFSHLYIDNNDYDMMMCRLTIQHARSFRLTQSFQPLALSHSTSNMSINFLGNTPLGRAQRLLAFVHSHKAVLNLIVRSRPNVLEGSLAALVRVTQLRSYLGFDAKRKYFFSQLRKMRPERGRRSVHLQLRRGTYKL